MQPPAAHPQGWPAKWTRYERNLVSTHVCRDEKAEMIEETVNLKQSRMYNQLDELFHNLC